MSASAAAQSYVTRKLNTVQNMGSARWTAVIIWLVGAWLTSTAFAQLNIPEPVNYAFGMAAQWILTKAESPIWRRQGTPLLGIGALFVDVLINSGGAWKPLQYLGQTDAWSMVSDILKEKPDAPKIEPTQMTILVLTIGTGAFTAGAAEYFWNLES
jgi:hypothetical protein